jgi:hypothetical protein
MDNIRGGQKMETILDKLINKNEFPVVFIGSGISKRFLVDFPDWTSLLEEFWEHIGFENFYGKLNNISDQLAKENPNYTEKELNHYCNIKVGSMVESQYNLAFNEGKVAIKDFSPKDAHRTKVSPFKKAISKRFGEYNIKGTFHNEYITFKKMLSKTQIILTTNYDKFIEDSYNENSNYQITTYIGQKGFFAETFGYAELYKLHGCVDSPADIIIAEKDYEKFEDNSVLISAKIISMMMNSPIIFMGYSLTDINVRKIIKDFTRSLNESELQILENRMVLIERLENEQGFIEEVVNDKDLGCKLKVIKTDNYQEVFNKISAINQGIAPTEVRKYQHVIKKLIIDRGKKGTLNSVLLSPDELDKLEGDLQTKNITVALGDAKYIFQIPDIISYSLDYISDKDEISNDIRMRFVVNQTGNSRFPIHKILDRNLINSCTLHPSEKDKLLGKINHYSNFNLHYKKINKSSVFEVDEISVSSIINVEEKKSKIYETLSFNIRSLNLDEVKVFLVKELKDLKEKGEIKLGTEIRRLLLLYDIRKNKRGNA